MTLIVFRACDVFYIATKFRIYLYVYKCDQFTEYLRRAFPEIYRAFGLGVHMYHIPPCAAALALPRWQLTCSRIAVVQFFLWERKKIFFMFLFFYHFFHSVPADPSPTRSITSVNLVRGLLECLSSGLLAKLLRVGISHV